MTFVMTVLDAAAGAFFSRELEYVKKTTYDVEYADLTYDKAFDVSTEVDPGATTITFQTYDRKGAARVVMNYAGDAPRVDVNGVETSIPVRTLEAVFGYNVDEINASHMTGKRLDTRRADTARRAIEELSDKITWHGDPKSGLLGVFTHPNIPTGNVPDPGSGSEWVNKTPIEIRDDVNLAFRTVFTTTNNKEHPNKLGLPLAQYSIFTETALSVDNDLTIAQWFVKNSKYINSEDDIMAIPELEGAGTAGVDVMLIWEKNPSKVQIEIPQDIFFHEPEKRGLEYLTEVTERFGGLHVYKPFSLLIMEDI